jgi:hypothetical protein
MPWFLTIFLLNYKGCGLGRLAFDFAALDYAA